MIIVAGHVRVAKKDRATFLKGSAQAVRQARDEPACLDFAVSADVVDAQRVNVYERWMDRSSLMAFRGEGPPDALNELIISAEVEEFEVLVPEES